MNIARSCATSHPRPRRLDSSRTPHRDIARHWRCCDRPRDDCKISSRGMVDVPSPRRASGGARSEIRQSLMYSPDLVVMSAQVRPCPGFNFFALRHINSHDSAPVRHAAYVRPVQKIRRHQVVKKCKKKCVLTISSASNSTSTWRRCRVH